MRKGRWEDIKIRLDDWGDWKIKPVPGIGYPSMSVEARMAEGGAGTAQKMWPKYEPNAYHSETDIAVNDLGDPKLIKLIEYRHVDKHKDSVIQIYTHSSQRKVAIEFSNAYAFIAGRLGYKVRY